MKWLNKHWQYAKYVIRHKWYVFTYARRLNLTWRGLLHDKSKFYPSEWFPYVEFFYGRKEPSGARPDWVKDNFNKAWNKHQKRNPHHWQYWLLTTDDGKTRALPMEETYLREMIADWMGAGKAIIGKNDIAGWYEKRKDTLLLHDTTRFWVEKYIEKVKNWK